MTLDVGLVHEPPVTERVNPPSSAYAAPAVDVINATDPIYKLDMTSALMALNQ